VPLTFVEPARAALLCAGLLVPGAAWARALRVPRTLATSFAGSVLALYLSVLLLQWLGIRIGLASLATTLLALSVAGFAIAAWRGRQGAAQPPPPSATPAALFRGLGWWSIAYTVFWAIALWRAGHEPLNGPDIEFRWGLLPEQMLRLGSLNFYPPRSAEDFATYFWAESIPPGVAALHGWAFACAGRFAPAWTIPGVVLQLWAVHELMWHTAEALGGRAAARGAVLGLAATPLLTWAVLMGQETGLLALATMGVIHASVGWQRQRQVGWAALAGGFAVLGAATREYGLAWLGFGAVGLVFGRATRRAWVVYAAVALLGLLWPLRTFVLTGNPLFSQTIGGWPVNLRFGEWLDRGVADRSGLLRHADDWATIARYLLLYAPLAIPGWIALGWTATRRGAAATGATVVMTAGILALWFWSVSHSDGGLFYSIRVATPALVAAALGAALALATAASRPAVGLTMFSALVAAGVPAGLALPANPWTAAARSWPAFTPPQPLPQGPADEMVALVLRQPGVRVVVTDGPGFGRRFAPTGVRAIPLWSPQADWLFDPAVGPQDAARRQRETGVTHLLIRKLEPNVRFLNDCLRRPDGRVPFRLLPAGETPHWALFAIAPAP
jgi:hypothetical protein